MCKSQCRNIRHKKNQNMKLLKIIIPNNGFNESELGEISNKEFKSMIIRMFNGVKKGICKLLY